MPQLPFLADFSAVPAMVDATSMRMYLELGYTVVRNVFNATDIKNLQLACDLLCEQAMHYDADEFVGVTYFNMFRDTDPFSKSIDTMPVHEGKIRRVTYPYAVNELLNAYRTHPRLLGVAAGLLGPDVVQVVNQVNFNHPGSAAGWGWHQDYRFRKAGLVDPKNHFVQILTAIDLCNTETGGLRLIPASDQLGGLTLDQDPATAENFFDVKDAVTPVLQPGDVVCFNPLIIHGSTPNKSPWQRRVYINGFAKASLPYGMPVLKSHIPQRDCVGKMEYEGDQKILPKASKY